MRAGALWSLALLAGFRQQPDRNAGNLAVLRGALHIEICTEALKIALVVCPTLFRHPVQLFQLPDSDKGI